MAGSAALATAVDATDPNLTACSQDDIFIAVMGVTGAGKSSFISQCCPHSDGIIGEDLDSFTKDLRKHTLTCKGKTVHLIDTPGFNDSSRKDTEILLQVATWLAQAYRLHARVNGLVYLHGIHDARMTGTDIMHLNMFQDLTGAQNMRNVVLATSYWDVTPEAKGEDRERKLRNNDRFWKAMEDKGAKVMRFKNDPASALAVVEYIVDLHKTTLEIQKEMEEQNKSVDQTAAGQTLDSEINKRVADVTKDLEKSKEGLEKAIKDKDEDRARREIEHGEELRKKVAELEENKRALDKTSEELIKQKDAEIKRAQEETARLKAEGVKANEEHKRQLVQKDEEKAKALQEMDREYDEAVKIVVDRAQAALQVQELTNSSQAQAARNEPLSEDRLEAMMRRLMREKEDAASRSPPPYYAAPPPPPMNPYPPYPQQSTDMGAALGGAAVGGASLVGLATLGLCNVM